MDYGFYIIERHEDYLVVSKTPAGHNRKMMDMEYVNRNFRICGDRLEIKPRVEARMKKISKLLDKAVMTFILMVVMKSDTEKEVLKKELMKNAGKISVLTGKNMNEVLSIIRDYAVEISGKNMTHESNNTEKQ